MMTSELSDAQVRREMDADCFVSKQTAPTHDDQVPAGDGYVNGTFTPTDDGGLAAPHSHGYTPGCAQNGTDSVFRADDGAHADDARPPPVTDDEGYRVEHRFETESVSRCKEVRDLADESTELRMCETKEVTLEELKTRDGETRPATADELRALLEAQWDGCDEVEISREVVVEEFNRVESQHEEVRPIGVTVFVGRVLRVEPRTARPTPSRRFDSLLDCGAERFAVS